MTCGMNYRKIIYNKNLTIFKTKLKNNLKTKLTLTSIKNTNSFFKYGRKNTNKMLTDKRCNTENKFLKIILAKSSTITKLIQITK